MAAFLCVLPLKGKREHKEVHVWILLDSACVYSPDDPAVYPYYAAAINLSCEYSYAPTPLSPSSESTNMWVALGTPDPTGLIILL